VTKNIVLDEMSPDDSSELTELYRLSPDTGRIQIAPRYHLDPYSAFAATRPNAVGVVARDSKTGILTGAGFVHFRRGYFGGDLRDCAFLSGVVVHPNFRRQGIATSIARWRIDYAHRELGQDVLIAAAIQKGNIGSVQVARTWAKQIELQVTAGATPVRIDSPRPIREGNEVRPADEDDFEEIANGLNEFYHGYTFFKPHTAKDLSEWLNRSPFPTRFNHYYVLSARRGPLLAGLAISEQYRATEMQVQHIPVAMRWLNKIVNVVPSDGLLKQLSVSKIWFAPGQMEAAQNLWEIIRWEWRTKANMLSFFYDPQSPITEVVKGPWWFPKGRFVLATSERLNLSKRILVYPI